MKIKIDVLQNSKDYLNQSLELAEIADEFGNHNEERANINAKIKWKLAFICIVQALELICKKCLSDVNNKLIYKDIDATLTSNKSTINLIVALTRLIDFTPIEFDEKEMKLLKKSILIRNDFVHYDVNLSTEELKTIFCRLLKIYTRIYIEFIEHTFYLSAENSRVYGNFIHFADHLVPYRGSEIKKDQLDYEINMVKNNQKFHYYISDSVKYLRVKFGTEQERFPEIFEGNTADLYTKYHYCDDCLAIKGEYHGEYCDLEICPKCKGQRLSCNCFDRYHY